jgi:hypothetical protein
MDFDDLKNAGGTPGGLIEFLIGLGMAVAGAYMLISRVMVTSAFWNWGGCNTTEDRSSAGCLYLLAL